MHVLLSCYCTSCQSVHISTVYCLILHVLGAITTRLAVVFVLPCKYWHVLGYGCDLAPPASQAVPG